MSKTKNEKKTSSLLILNWPRLEWNSEMWLTLIPFVMSFVVFFYPKFAEDNRYEKIRFAIGLPLLFAPLYIPIIVWLWKLVGVGVRRILNYPQSRLQTENANCELFQLKQEIFRLVKNTRENIVFEIGKVAYHQNTIYIAVRWKKELELKRDDTLVVLHLDDGRLMGIFRVVEIRENEYYAQGVRHVDPLWSGYVREREEIGINPFLAAFYVPQGEINNE